MKISLIRPLALEPIEDRLAPSRGWEPAGPRPNAPAAFGDHADRFRPMSGPGDRGARRLDDRPTPFLPWVNVSRPIAEVKSAEVATAVKVASAPAAQVREPAPTAIPVRGVTAALSERAAVPVSAVVSVAALVDRTPGGPATPSADKPAGPAAAENAWPVAFVGTNLDAPPTRPTPGTPAPAVPETERPEDAPAPNVVERVLDAVLPGGVPLHGVLPLAAEWIEAGTADLLAGLAGLGEDAADGPVWEQMTWLAGAVLVLGGVTYTVGTHCGRRHLHRAVIGTDSALARWEDKNARRTTA